MAFNKFPGLFPGLLTTCCAATFSWSTATAQGLAGGGEVGFAGAGICQAGLIEVPVELQTAPGGDGLPVTAEADRIEVEGDGTVVLRGNAQAVQGNRGVYADRIVYYRNAGRAVAEGNVVFHTSNQDEIRADALDMKVDTFVGEAREVGIRIADRDPFRGALSAAHGDGGDDDGIYVRARAVAQNVQFDGGNFQRLENVEMTTCAEGNRDVLLSAKEIELDHAAGLGTAKSMTVKFKKVPIFYFPTATFPINDQRKTGFLFPSAGYDDESGLIVEAPYYLNLAPQYDATLTPKVLSKRGAQLFGRFRYLSENAGGTVRGEFLPSDNQYDDEDRHAFGYDHHQFGDRWSAAVDYQSVSDSAYLRDFSNQVDIVASSYLRQTARLDYLGKAVKFNAWMAAYDSINDSVARFDRPHEILPRLRAELKPWKLGFLTTGAELEYANFRHDDSGQPGGTRLRVKPYLSAPLKKNSGYIEPKASLQTIRYSLDGNTPGTDDSRSVDAPIFSLDSGLFFEREFERGGTPYSQTLEPRLFYVTIPNKRAQRKFPDFDTSNGSDSSFDHFFRENRFFGGDRVGDTEQISVGVSSRIVNNDTGRQRLKLSFGQVFYLRDRVIGLDSDSTADTDDTSGFLGEVTAAITENWGLTGFARWDDSENELDALRISSDYEYGESRNASAVYTFNDGTSEQIKVALETPLWPRWRLRANTAYSLEQDKTRSSEVGLSFDACCWAVRAVARRYLDGEGEQKNHFVVTLELDDLGRIGARL